LILNILSQEVLPIPKYYSENMKEMVSLLLKKDPNSRPSIEEIFQMEFIQNKIKLYNFEDELEAYNENKKIEYQMNSNKKNKITNFQIKSEIKPSSLNEWGSSLFEFGFGNLLNENDETILNPFYSQNQMIDKKIYNGKGVLLPEKNQLILNNKKVSGQEGTIQSQSNSNSKYHEKFQNMEKKFQKIHRHSPSYNNMIDILSSVNNYSIVGSLSNNQTNLSKFSKNQNSFPEYQGIKSENKDSPLNSLNTVAINSPMKLTMEQSKIF
jgi:hypothetical protein